MRLTLSGIVTFFKFILFITLIASACCAQQAISVYASAVNAQNQPVELSRASLVSKDITITAVEKTKPSTLSCVIVWDSSNSERDIYARMQQAAELSMQKLYSAVPHRCAFLSFDSAIQVAKGWTEDPIVVARHLAETRIGGGTSAYDALGAAAGLLDREESAGPRVIYFFTDFEDNQSTHTIQQATAAVLRSGARIYAFAPDPAPTTGGLGRGRALLKSVVATTGGEIILVPIQRKSSPEKLKESLTRGLDLISGELNAWWVISFTPPLNARPDAWQHLKLGSADKNVRLSLPVEYFVGK